MSVALAANALTTLETVKTLLGIDPDDVDPKRGDAPPNLINYASAWIESMTGRIFKQQTYVQRYAAAGAQELVLKQWPVTDVEYVKDLTSRQVIPDTEYEYTEDGRIGVLYKDDGWAFR